MVGLQRIFLFFLSALLAVLLLALPQSSGLTQSYAPAIQKQEHVDEQTLHVLRSRRIVLARQLAQYAPSGYYLVVDTARNRLFVKRKDEVVLEATASTGSGTILDKPGQANAQWVFDTPRGEFTIQSKLTNPVWVKPDWAYLEEGREVPSDPAERVEAGVLGEYALGFGKGYFIHGTLYTRLLGKHVTHGCIRLSDNDLKAVYRLAKIGTPIMIF